MTATVLYEPYSLTVDPTDDVFDDWTITKVVEHESCWEVSGRYTCLVPLLTERTMAAGRHSTPTPQVGDTLRVYGRLGQPIQGQVLNGVVLWYRWPVQREARRRRELEDLDAQRARRFVLDRAALDARYDALPAVFRTRLDRFRDEDPAFRERDESYESFILEQAALLADHFGDVDALTTWAALPAAQQPDPPGYATDQHSGNTHGMAVVFAQKLLRGEPV